jgi:hypothetical protein
MWRLAGRALVAGLCIAAATAIAALVSGDLDDTHARVIATSLGFSVCSALGAAGDALRRRAPGAPAAVGAGTVGAALLAFVLLCLAVWGGDDNETLWRSCAVCALLALWGSHASLVLRGRRREDSAVIELLVATSIVAAGFDTLVAVGALLEAEVEVGEGFVRFVAVVLVVMLVTTALPPLLRRVAGPSATARADAFGRPAAKAPEPALTLAGLADEVTAAADRLEAAQTAGDVRREAAALRELAARARD